MTATSEMPPLLEYVLFRVSGRRKAIADRIVYAGVPVDAPAYLQRLAFPSGITGEWAPKPSLDDPRWRPYDTFRPQLDEMVVVKGQSWGKPGLIYVDVDFPVDGGKLLPYFMDGPPTRDWGVLATMPIDEAFRDAKVIPPEILNKRSYYDWMREQHDLAAKAEAENLYLSFINDGQTYRWLTPYLKRSDKVLHKTIHSLLHKLVPQSDRNYEIWYDAVKQAKADIFFYYREIHG